MADKFELSHILKAASDEMLGRFTLVRQLIKHPSEKGSALEDAVKDFWKAYLPANIGITSGFVVGSDGVISKQMDIIFYDALHTPIFFATTSLSIVPVECTIACCEVKSAIKSKEKILETYMTT